ncbi:MAG: site-specific integrase [Bryobacteraceae bacterium]
MAPPKRSKPRPDGRYQALGIDPATGKRKAFYSRISQADADAKAQQSRRIAKAGFTPDLGLPPDTLWGFYVHSAWPTFEVLSENWRSQVKWAMVGYIAPALGRKRFSELNRVTIQAFFNQLARLTNEDGTPTLSPSSINRIKIVLSRIVNLAIDDGLIQTNIMRNVRTAPNQRTTRRSLRPHELRALYEAAPDYGQRVILLMGFCGLRVGEACGLMWSDIDEKGVLRPSGQVLQLPGGARRVETLKTPTSYNPVPVSPKVISRLKEGATSIFVAPARNGAHLLPNNVQRMLDEACKDAGIERVRCHELRHTFISILENVLEVSQTVSCELSRKVLTSATREYSRSWLELRMQKMSEYFEVVMSATDPADIDTPRSDYNA